MYLLIDKLMSSTLDFSLHGSLAPALLYFMVKNKEVTRGIPAYIWDAAHTPAMKEYLIRRSNEATGHDKSWDEATYNSIDWRHHHGKVVFKKLSNGRRIQISKYINDLLPTKRRLATFDNRVVDGRCFACNQLWEDTTHMLTCTCDVPACEARK
jgi:hypothetical protein